MSRYIPLLHKKMSGAVRFGQRYLLACRAPAAFWMVNA